MSTTHRISGSIVARGQKIYDEKLRSILEPEHNGKYVVIDVDTGEYEVDEDHLAASDRAHKNKPGKVLFATKVGFGALGRLRTPIRVRKNG
jgi:hypothetical protein